MEYLALVLIYHKTIVDKQENTSMESCFESDTEESTEELVLDNRLEIPTVGNYNKQGRIIQQNRNARQYTNNNYANQGLPNTNQGSQVSQLSDINSVAVSVNMRELEKMCMGGQSFMGDYDEGSGIMVRRQVRTKVWSTVKFLPSSLLENISGLYQKINEPDNLLSVILSATNEVKYLKKGVDELPVDIVFKLWKLYYHDVQKELSCLRSNQNKSLKAAMVYGMIVYVIFIILTI